jgi:hypothetical protein
MAADIETRAANVRTRETRILIDGYEHNTRKSGGDRRAVWESWEGGQRLESRATDWPPEAGRVLQAETLTLELLPVFALVRARDGAVFAVELALSSP